MKELTRLCKNVDYLYCSQIKSLSAFDIQNYQSRVGGSDSY